jgi:hypothetical protein
MPFPRIALALAAASVALVSSAARAESAAGWEAPNFKRQHDSDGTWDKEPQAVFGVKLGARFEQQVPECPRDRDAALKAGRLCYYLNAVALREGQTRYDLFAEGQFRYYTFGNMPSLGAPVLRHVALVSDDGSFQGVLLFFRNTDYATVRSLFVSRYGNPSGRQVVIKQARIGARFASERTEWKGDNVTISIDQIGRTVNETTAVITTTTFMRTVDEKFRAATQKYKDNL